MPRINPTLPADGDTAVVEPYNAAITAILGVLNGAVDADNLAAGAVTLAALSTAVAGALVPTGAVIAFGGTTAPSGFLMCDGSSYLRGSFSALFAVTGTSYGSADGTHFNVPDLRGRAPIGSDAMGGTAANRIQRSTTLTTTSGSASATVASATGLAVGMYITSTNVPAGTTIASFTGTTITMSANATANGSAVAARFSMLNNDAQNLGAMGGEDVHQLITSELASHVHQTTFTQGIGGLASGGGIGQNKNNAGFGDNTTGTGSDQAHNNLSPTVTTNYIIKT